MSALSIQVPYQIFADSDGTPLDNGYVWIGTPYLDPRTNPVTVYFDASLTQVAPNPLRTVNGYVYNAGSPAQLYIDGVNFSLRVEDKKSVLVYSFPAGSGISPNASGVVYNPAGTGAVATTVQSKLREEISADDYGAIGNDSADDTLKLQALFDSGAGKRVKLRSGAVYKCTDGLVVKGDVDGEGATLKFYGTAISYLVSQSVEGSLRKFTIDGSNVTSCQNGLFVDTDFVQKHTCNYDLTIKNISNSNNTQGCNGALFYKASSASVNLNSQLDIKINVTGVTATSNGIIGDNGGAATGILVSFNGAGCDSNVTIRDSVVKDVSSGGADPYEDACGVHVAQSDGALATAKGEFIIRNVKVYNAKKRGFKVQAAHTLIEDCVCYGQDTQAGFETYSLNTTFSKCKHLLGSNASFTTTSANTRIYNCYAEITAAAQCVRLYPGSSGVDIDGLVVSSTATYPSRDYGALLCEGTSYPQIHRVSLGCTTNTGSGIICSGTNQPRIDKLSIGGFQDAVYLAYSTGELFVSNANISVTGSGFYRLGNTSNPIRIIDSVISADSIGFYTESSAGANSCTVDAENVKVFANSHGALVPSGCRFINCEFTSVNTAGYGLLSGNSTVRQCKITKYSVGVGYSYSTTAEVADNVTIGTTTPYEKVGYTAFVDQNNNSR